MDAALRLVTGDDTTSSCTADTGHHHHHGAGGGGFHYTHVVTGGDGNAVTDEADQYVTRTDSLSEPAPFDSYSLSPHIQLRTDAQTYTVVTSSRSGDGDAATHLLEKTAGGGSTFCLQAVGPFVGDSSDSAKSLPQHFIIPDVVGGGTDASGSTYHLGPGGEVYKLVVQADGSKQSDPSAVADHGASQLHLSSSVALDSLLADSHPHLESSSVGVGRCVVCDVQLCDDADGQAVSLYRTCVQSSGVSLAVKLRQLLLACTAAVSDAAPPEFHSELACQPCAALLSSIDGLEARLQELRDRLELARHDLLLKYSRTGARYGCATLTTPSMVQRAEAASLVETASEAPPATAGVCRASQRTTSKKAGHTRQQQRELQPSQRPISKEKQAVVPLQGDHDRPLHQVISDVAACTSRKRPAARTGVQKVAELAEALLDQPDPDDPVGQIPQETINEFVADDDDDCCDDEDDEEHDEELGSPPLKLPPDRAIRVANACPTCDRVFINPLVMQVHQLVHGSGSEELVDGEEVDSGVSAAVVDGQSTMGADVNEAADVLARAVEQMNSEVLSGDASAPPIVNSPLVPAAQASQRRSESAGVKSERSAERDDVAKDGVPMLVFKCDTCAALFRTQRTLQLHFRRSHTQAVWRCHVCWDELATLRQLRHHVATHGEQNSCPVCLETFPTKLTLKLHVNRQHPQTQSRHNYCELCNKSFNNQGFLDHARGVHGITATRRAQDTRQFHCTTCDQQLSGAVAYVRHMRMHRKRYACPFCGKSFHSRSTLENHRHTHTGEKPFNCPDCQRCFMSNQARESHIRAFHRYNPYTCAHCNRRCESKASYMRHMRSHAGAADFQCVMCGKKMTTEYSLKVHVRAIHMGSLPFRCQLCGKTFAYKSSLTMHMNTHTGDKAFICDVCGKCFGSRSSLRTHLHSHSDTKPYPCDWCERGFSRKDLLARHKLQSHGIQPEVQYSRMVNKLADPEAQLPIPAVPESQLPVPAVYEQCVKMLPAEQ